MTPIYHPNVDRKGNIYLDIFMRGWGPQLKVGTILLTISSVLGTPIEPYYYEMADMYKFNPERMKRIARG